MRKATFALPAVCLAIGGALAPLGWTQDEAPRSNPATERRRGSDEEAVPRTPPPVREVPVGEEVRGRNPGAPVPFPSGRGLAAPDGRNAGRDGQVPMRARTISKTISEVIYQPVDPDEMAEFMAYREARQALKDAKDEAARKTASEKIRQHLEKQFDRDLSQREQDLAAVEERVKVLRQQFDRRKSSKEEIVTLRLKTMLNNADGLGFPGEDEGNDFTGIMPVHVRATGARSPYDSDPTGRVIEVRPNNLDPNLNVRPQPPAKRDQPALANPGEGRGTKEGRPEPR